MEATVDTIPEKYKLWHMRLGHPSMSVMKKIDVVKGKCNARVHENCSVCPKAKHSRLKFPISNSRSVCPFQLVHMDFCGPYKTTTLDMKSYFLTIVGDHTRFTWVYLLQFKSDVIIALKLFLFMVKNQFAANIKIMRSNNGTEFFNALCNDLLNQHGIVH